MKRWSRLQGRRRLRVSERGESVATRATGVRFRLRLAVVWSKAVRSWSVRAAAARTGGR